MNRNQVKRLILHNQHITNPILQEQVVKDMCGLQAQFFNNPKQALSTRSQDYEEENWQMNMIKTWTIRGTLHMIHEEDLPLFMAIHTLPSWFESYNQDIPQKEIETIVEMHLKENNTISRKELAELMEHKGYDSRITEVATNAWGGIFMKMCHKGTLIFSDVNKRDFKYSNKVCDMNDKKAKEEVLRRYFKHYGPATINDASYFTKFKKSDIKLIINEMQLDSCEIEKRTYYYFHVETVCKSIPKVLLLGAFDPLMLGYEKKESLFLRPEHIRGIFNLTGIVFAPILYKGDVIGRWKVAKKTMVCSLFEENKDSIKKEIERFVFKNKKEVKEIIFDRFIIS